MNWSFRLGTAFGIPVFMHWTFLLLLGFVALNGLVATGSMGAALSGVVFVALIFACVVLHEFGHALMARRYGIGTREVTLLPIGGLARLNRMPEDPRQELAVALAGPAVNFAIAGVLAIWLILTGPAGVAGGGWVEGSLAARLLTVNLGLVAFNMLPAFPMDGGRVLRALLAQRVGHGAATEYAATIGRGMAILFGILGMLWNPMLILIAAFVWFGAGQEAAIARRRQMFGDRTRPWASHESEERSPVGRRVYRVGPWLVYRDHPGD
jgi:Zn-dependent protease